MTAARRIRLAPGRFAEVEAPPDARVLDVLSSLMVSARLGDGRFTLHENGRELPLAAPVSDVAGSAWTLEPQAEVKGRLGPSLPSEPLSVGTIRVRFLTEATSSDRDDVVVKVVGKDGALPSGVEGRTLDPRDLPEWRPGTIYCIGCARTVGAGDAACPDCSTPVRGKFMAERVEAVSGQPVQVPSICCCCLAPSEMTRSRKVLTFMRGNVRYYAHVPLPWCRTCRGKSVLLGLIVAFFGIAALAAWVFAGMWISEQGYNNWAGFFGGLAVAVAVYGLALLLERSAAFNLPGHVRGCQGLSGAVFGKDENAPYELVFGNRQFARQWRALNTP